MERTEIQDRLLPIISKYLPDEVSKEDIKAESDLLKDLQINSAYLVDIIIAIEEEFDIAIEDEILVKMNTVEESILIIEEKINAK